MHRKTLQNGPLELYLSLKGKQPILESLEGCVSQRPPMEGNRNLQINHSQEGKPAKNIFPD